MARSALWQTCEDLYTQSYVLPYLVPMLENAGACVLLPRERDVQKYEVLADNDNAGQYAEEGRGRAAARASRTSGRSIIRAKIPSATARRAVCGP